MKSKDIKWGLIVVDPNPSPSFIHSEVDLIKMTASDFCKMYF